MGVFMCSTLGTPTEDVWPNVTKLPYYNKEFPKWPIRSIKKTIECLDPLAEDLLNVGIGWMVDHVQKMFCYNPGKRINAWDALHHPWFDDLDKSKFAPIPPNYHVCSEKQKLQAIGTK